MIAKPMQRYMKPLRRDRMTFQVMLDTEETNALGDLYGRIGRRKDGEKQAVKAVQRRFERKKKLFATLA